MFELIFSRKAFMAIKEKLEKGKYRNEGPKGDINVKPKDAPVPPGQRVEKGLDFVEKGPVEKLEYPKVAKEASTMDKSAAQKLPGSDKIDAGGKQFIDGGDTEKLQFPSKPGPDPKIKMQGLDSSAEARKCIDGGEKEKLDVPSSGGPKIKVEWNVNSDEAIGEKFKEKGDKGDVKKVHGPAKEPGVSAQKDGGHISKAFDSYEHAKPFQKQFSLNFTKSTLTERRQAAQEAVDDAVLSLEAAAAKCGVSLWSTPLANAYGSLLIARAGMKTHGEIYLTAGKAQEESREALKCKYEGDMSKCMDEQKGNVDDPAAFCKWVESAVIATSAPLKVQASVVNDDPEGLKSAEQIGRMIF